MKKQFYFGSQKFFFLIIFLSLIFPTITTLSFKFPTSITLNNGNIFIIHQTGVTICNPNCTEVIKNVKDFSSDQQISEVNLSKVSIIKYDDDFIISFIIDQIFIFNSDGTFKQRSSALTMQK